MVLKKRKLNQLNQQIMGAVFSDFKCGFLPSVVNGKMVFRVCITNHRTTYEDIDFLVDWIVTLGKKQLKEAS